MEYKVKTQFNRDMIIQSSGFDGPDYHAEMTRRIINLQDDGVEQALIKLGWTPPDCKS